MNIDILENMLKKSWSKETCSPSLRDMWDEFNPSLGQCAISALIVKDYFGGKIMRCMTSTGSHYYNLIDNNIVDLTASQFIDEVPNYSESSERTRLYLLGNSDTKSRYLELLKSLKENFVLYGKDIYKLIDSSGKTYESKIPGMYGGNKKLKIYGKMDCPSANKWIKKGYYTDNRVFFEDEETAKSAGYRPCAICMKKEYKNWKESK